MKVLVLRNVTYPPSLSIYGCGGRRFFTWMLISVLVCVKVCFAVEVKNTRDGESA